MLLLRPGLAGRVGAARRGLLRPLRADPHRVQLGGHRFNAYDSTTGQKETVIHRALDGGLDINAQICFHQFDGKTYFIAGEDRGQKAAPGEPEPEGSPGWGWFELVGSSVGSLTATQHGKLVPTWSPGLTEQAENYGCGFLPDGRLVTTDVGNQFPHTPASGQLVLWFPDPTKGFDDTTHVALTSEGKVPRDFDVTSDIDNRLDANYCKIDTQIATAGGSWVHSGWVYVAASRPGPAGPGGIYRYEIADFPKDATCSTYPYVSHDNQTDLVAAGAVTRELWLASDAHVETPSALVPSGRSYLGFPTWYVSSAFTGVVAEYADLGHTRVWVRNVVEPPGGLPVGQADDLPLNTSRSPASACVGATAGTSPRGSSTSTPAPRATPGSTCTRSRSPPTERTSRGSRTARAFT